MARNPVAARRHWRAGPATPGPESAGKPLKLLLLSLAGLGAVAIVGASVTRRETPPSTTPRLEIPVVGAAGPAPETATAAAPEPAAALPAFMDADSKGAAAYRQGDYATALASYKEAVEKNPNDAEALSNLGQVLVRMQQPEAALPYFDRAIAQIPDRWAYHFNRARALGLLQRWDEAVAGYQRAQEIYPDDYAIAFNLGQALQRKGDDAAAVEQYKRAAALDPGEPSFQMALGMTYERLKKPAEAAAAYTEALRLAPDAPDAERVRTRIAALTRTGS